MRKCEITQPGCCAFAVRGKHPACRTLGNPRIAESSHKTLETDRAASDARGGLRIERKIGPRFRLSVIQWLADGGRIESLAHQELLLLLEGLGGIQRGGDAQEQRVRISRQAAREMIGESGEIEAVGEFVREMAQRYEQLTTSASTMLKEIKTTAARYRKEGKRIFNEIESCSSATDEVRQLCDSFRDKISAKTTEGAT